MTDTGRDQTAFTAVDGSSITRSELDQMTLFLGTDSNDKLLFGGVWGPNFLNDGVIQKDFLETGLASMLAKAYMENLSNDLHNRLEKEKHYNLYSHPQAKFLNAENAWNYFAPNLKESLQALKKSNQSDDDAFDARVSLFLAEKQFPAPSLKQVLRYQEKQYSWLPPDEALNSADLSLFGYHTVDDWFGPHFVRLISQFIINAAKIAEQKGYKVTKEEALADLMRNAETSFKQNKGSPYLALTHPQAYLSEQLRRMSMDQVQAIKVWRQVLLFRRLFQEVGNAVFVDEFEYAKFDQYAKETAVGDLYHLPKSLQFGSYKDLQKFQVYLAAVAGQKDSLDLPKKFFSLEKISQTTPELVQKNYRLEISEVDKKNLQAKVTLKDTWNWEVNDKNWEILKQQFPELGIKSGKTREERLKSLDSLDDKTRAKIDSFARMSIVETKPEWISEALTQVKPTTEVVGIQLKGGNSFFEGLTNSTELMKKLDNASPDQPLDLSFDQKTFYRIKVLEKDPQLEVLTFAEANLNGVLDKLLNDKLEAYYQTIRGNKAASFQNVDRTWKPLLDVQDQVADLYFEPLLKAIREDVEKNGPESEKRSVYNGDFYATHRLYPFVREAKAKIQTNPETTSIYVSELNEELSKEQQKKAASLADQWKLEKQPFSFDRSGTGNIKKVNVSEVFSMDVQNWSDVHVFPNGEMTFIYLKEKKEGADAGSIALKMEKVQNLLSDEAQRILMRKALQEIKTKNAIIGNL